MSKYKYKYLLSHLNLVGLSVSILLIMVVFNLFNGMLLSDFTLDITGDKRYSLTQTTQDFLKNNQIPINARLYVSKNIKKANLLYGAYADYINRVIEKYVSQSHGMIKFTRVEIEPFTASEIEAQKAGITDIKLADATFKLGARFTTALGNSIVIPQFDILRSDILEDDLDRKLSFLVSKKRPFVGIISPYFNIASQDKLMNQDSDWQFIAQLEKSGYRFYPIPFSAGSIPEELDAVLVFYPVELQPLLNYALDQYLLKGGSVMIMLDSLSRQRYIDNGTIIHYNSGMDDFLQHHGIKYYNTVAVGDVDNNRIVEMEGQSIRNPFYPVVKSENMAKHPINENLNQLNFEYTSLLSYQANNQDLFPTILLSTGENSGILPAVYMASKDYLSLSTELKTFGAPLPLAILLEGNFQPFYTMPLITTVTYQAKQPIFINTPEAEGKLLVVADSDLASIYSWQDEEAVKRGQIYTSDNLFFIRNALDYLTGTDLVSAGSKYLASSQRKLGEVLYDFAQKRYSNAKRQLFAQMTRDRNDITDLENEFSDDNFNMPIKFKKRLKELQESMQQTETGLKRIEYQTQEYHRFLMNFFTAFIIIFSFLASLFIVYVVYRIVCRFTKKG